VVPSVSVCASIVRCEDAKSNRSLPSSFKGAVLVGGAPLMQFRGLRATLRVSGSAWRLDIPVPRQYRQSLNGGPSSVVVLQTSEGERYRWIRAEGGEAVPMELDDSDTVPQDPQVQQRAAVAQGLAGWALAFDMTSALERVSGSKRPDVPHPVFSADIDSCVTVNNTVLDGYKVSHVFLWPAEYNPEQTKQLHALMLAARPQGKPADAAATAKVLQVASSHCAPVGQLSAIVQEVEGRAFGAHSHVSLVFSHGLQECELDPQLFVPPEHIALAQLPFPVGLQLLKIAAAQAGTSVPEPPNPNKKKHSSSGLL